MIANELREITDINSEKPSRFNRVRVKKCKRIANRYIRRMFRAASKGNKGISEDHIFNFSRLNRYELEFIESIIWGDGIKGNFHYFRPWNKPKGYVMNVGYRFYW